MNRLTLLLLTSLAPISWGTTYLVTTEMLPAGHPLLAGLLRSLPAGLVALGLGRALPPRGWWLKSLALGILNIGAFFPLLFLAAERLPGGVAAAVAGVQPLIILCLGALVLRDRIRPLTAAAAAVGAGGVALVVLGPAAELDPVGIIAAVGGVTATALGMILTKRWGRPAGVGPVAYAGWQLTAGGLFLLPLTLVFEGFPPPSTAARYSATSGWARSAVSSRTRSGSAASRSCPSSPPACSPCSPPSSRRHWERCSPARRSPRSRRSDSPSF